MRSWGSRALIALVALAGLAALVLAVGASWIGPGF
jgi:hypothetical protein